MKATGPLYSVSVQEIYRKKIILPLEFSEEAQEFLDLLLCIDPNDRISAAEALQNPWFNDIEQLNDIQCDDIDIQSNN